MEISFNGVFPVKKSPPNQKVTAMSKTPKE